MGPGDTDPGIDFTGNVIWKSHRAELPATLERMAQVTPMHPLIIVRDASSAFASLIRTQNADRGELLGWLRSDIETIEQALAVTDRALVLRAESIDGDAIDLISRICSTLGIGLPPAEVASIAAGLCKAQVRSKIDRLTRERRWTNDFTNYDTTSHWHAAHIAPHGYTQPSFTAAEIRELAHLNATIDTMANSHGFAFSAKYSTTSHVPDQHLMPPWRSFVIARQESMHVPESRGILRRFGRSLARSA